MSTENKREEYTPPIIESNPTFRVLGRYFNNKKDAEDYVAHVNRVKAVRKENKEKLDLAGKSVVCIEKEGMVDLAYQEINWLKQCIWKSSWSDEEISEWEVPIKILDDVTAINQLFDSLANGAHIYADNLKTVIACTNTVMERSGNTDYKRFMHCLAMCEFIPEYVDVRD